MKIVFKESFLQRFENQIRDLIFKGYTIVFRINNKQIEIFGFIKYQRTPTD